MSELKHVVQNDGKIRQFLAAIVVNLIALSYGTACAWSSPMIPLLRSNASPVGSTPLDDEGDSWISSLLCLGGMLISPFSGTLADKIGRKRFGYATCVPMLLCWLITIFATSHACLFVARFLAGVGGAMSIFLVPAYVSEIASESIRGALGSLLVLAINLGILMTFIAGAYLPYAFFGIFLMIFPLLFLGAFIFMPETPVHLIKQNRLHEATRSLMFFKGNNKALVDKELAHLVSNVNNTGKSTEKLGLRDLFCDRATFKGLIISFGLLGGQQMCGIFAMISYAARIFEMAGSSLSPNAAAIIIGVIQLIGSFISTLLMERAGRRPLVLVSCAGMCICHFIVGLFSYLKDAKYDVSSVSFIPVLAVSCYMITYCLGMGPVPFVITSEVFRVDISSFAGTFCLVFLWISAFVVVKVFGPLMNLIGIGGCFFMLGTFCACTFFFSYALVPETKGRSREEIVDELAGIRKTDTSLNEKTYVSCKDTNNKELMASEQV